MEKNKQGAGLPSYRGKRDEAYFDSPERKTPEKGRTTIFSHGEKVRRPRSMRKETRGPLQRIPKGERAS